MSVELPADQMVTPIQWLDIKGEKKKRGDVFGLCISVKAFNKKQT